MGSLYRPQGAPSEAEVIKRLEQAEIDKKVDLSQSISTQKGKKNFQEAKKILQNGSSKSSFIRASVNNLEIPRKSVNFNESTEKVPGPVLDKKPFGPSKQITSASEATNQGTPLLVPGETQPQAGVAAPAPRSSKKIKRRQAVALFTESSQPLG